jgi:BirA family transcriptional regulator, biotin operon repressor / biotin---[acetyl-CoA-carboxylase] ligase
MAEPLARVAHRLGFVARRVLWYAEITSTNDLAASLADGGVEEGCVVAADAQSAGRGRLGRAWVSPAGAGVYASVVLRPPPHACGLMTLAAGVAIAEGVQAATGLQATVKWPNDLLVDRLNWSSARYNTPSLTDRRKVAGILAEAGATADGVQHVIVGFGINLLPAAYPPEVAARATSIEAELGRPVDRGLVLAECLVALASRYRDLCVGRGARVVAEWRRRAAATFGRGVEWDEGGTVHRGVAEGIDEGGALLVRTGAGLTRVTSGEVRWR